MTRKGSITVYLCLLLSIFLVIFQVIYQSVRLAGARTQVAAGMQQSLYSLFAQYDQVLLEEYDLFFLDGSFGKSELRQDLLCNQVLEGVRAAAEPKSGGKKDIWGISLEKAGLTGYTLATDRQGEAFRKQAVEAARSSLGSQGIRRLFSLVESGKETMKRQEGIKQEGEKALEDYDMGKEQAEKDQKESEQAGEGQEQTEFPAQLEENPIEVIRKIWKMGVLGLVIKNTEVISQQILEKSKMVSGRSLNQGFGLQKLPQEGDMTDKLLFQEYLLKHLDCYTDDNSAEGVRYQLEYIIQGKNGDMENLKGVANQLLLVREASNFTYLLTSPPRRAEAAAMSSAIAMSFGIPIAEGLVRKALQVCWAFGESILDVRTLMEGGQVPLIKSDSSWQLQLEQLIHLLEGLDGFRKDNQQGLTYRDYLRLLLLSVSQEKQVMRGMDMVEYQVRCREGKENFRLDCCIAELQACLEVRIGAMSFYADRGYGYGEE